MGNCGKMSLDLQLKKDPEEFVYKYPAKPKKMTEEVYIKTFGAILK